MKGYVARDDNGEVFLFNEKPFKTKWAWNIRHGWQMLIEETDLPSDINPQWEDDEPIEVNIEITKVKK